MCLFMCRRREKIMEGITMLDPKKVRLGICPIGWSNKGALRPIGNRP